eukprot:253044_1
MKVFGNHVIRQGRWVRALSTAVHYVPHNNIHSGLQSKRMDKSLCVTSYAWSQMKGTSFVNNHSGYYSLNGQIRRYSSPTKSETKMARVTEQVKMNFPRRNVWTVLSDFGNLDWQYNTIDSVDTEGPDGVGQTRSLHIKGISHPIKEKLLTMDHDNFSFSIQVDHGWVLPFGDYTCKCNIDRIDNKTCTITWIGEFEVLGMEEEEGAKLASGIYKQMFRDLPKYMTKKGY